MAEPFVWGTGGVQMTPERIAAERKVAQAMVERGMDFSPVEHWTQGLARVAQAVSGGLDLRSIQAAERANVAAERDMIKSWFPGAAPSAPAPAAPVAPIGDRVMALDTSGQPVLADDGGIMPPAQPNYRDAIASIESAGSKNPYGVLGPVTASGDRAHGRYQVMGANIGPWSEAALGRRLTPEQFLADPAAQDRVFDHRFGTYVAQTGNPQDAAAMWFSGRPLAGNTSRDQLGTSVPTYVQKFAKAMGPQAEDPAALPPNATPTSGYVIPGQPAPVAAPAGNPLGSVNPSVLNAVMSPYTSEGTKKIASLILSQQLGENKATDEMREYSLYRQQGGKDSFFDYKSGLKKAGAQNTVINNTVNPVLKGIGDRFNESMDTARASVPQIQSIHEARKALDQGAITGVGADTKLFGAKVANMFGLGLEQAANTEVLRSSIGNSVLAKAKTLGANPSNADRDYIEKVVGGSIALEEGSIRRLLDMQEKWARDAIRRANAEGRRVLSSQPDELKNVSGLLSVDEPEDYATFLKNNPITAPTTAAPPPPGGKVRKYNPATGKIE